MRVLPLGFLTLMVLPCAAERTRRSEQLKSLSLEQLGNVRVTTVSKEPEEWHAPAAVYVMKQADIERSGAITLPELLRMISGVHASRMRSGRWAVGFRGSAGQISKSLLVLIDGRSVCTPSFEGACWDAQDTMLQDIDRIEVIRGLGGTILGGNAVHDVINIITKRPQATQGTLATAGSGNLDHFVGAVCASPIWRP